MAAGGRSHFYRVEAFMKDVEQKKHIIIDIHTHAFPDEIALNAVPLLASKANVKPALNGTLKALEQSMDKAGIDISTVCSIATKPSQFRNIVKWSAENSSNKRFVFLPSVHPASQEPLKEIEEVAKLQFRGIKMHPYYQEFVVDEERMFPLYRKMAELGLFLICHTGFDIAFPRKRMADPIRIRNVIKKVPNLKFIATHTGAWEDWDEVEKQLAGENVYIETSFSISYLGKAKFRNLLLKHNPELLLFGTDSPWSDQSEELAAIRSAGFSEELLEKITGRNAQKLLKLFDI
jgi:predicted TIM-barrel fold metal-dependent hydrolase